MYRDRNENIEGKVMNQPQRFRIQYKAKYNICIFIGAPPLTPLAFASYLFMGKDGSSV